MSHCTTKWPVHLIKTQISQGIRPVWSNSLLSTWRNLGSLASHWVYREDSDQTAQMPKLIWVFAGHTCHFFCFFFVLWLTLKLFGNVYFSSSEFLLMQKALALNNSFDYICSTLYERSYDKTNKVAVRPAKTQISLGICPVWSESLLCTQWVAKDPSFLHADSEGSDQTGRMPRLIWVFAGCTLTFWFCHEAAHMCIRLM